MKKGHILIIDDNQNVLTALRILLQNYFQTVTLMPSPKQLISQIKSSPPDVILLDMNFTAGINTGNEGLYWLSEILKLNPDIPVVLFTAYADIDLAVKALKEGATDFVVKPWDNSKLLATLQSAYALRESRKEVHSLKEKQAILNTELNKPADLFRGTSPQMEELWAMIKKVAKTDANVLITGENGTGKEVIAREIHRQSARNKSVMITVDMGAITESLFESELFGHVKGAFTDAKSDRAGKFEAANSGTLFLDEIGNLPYPMQAKLLSVLQSRQITRVGSNKVIPIDIRLISATNRDIMQSAKEGSFREDLLYRINTIRIEVPPLRERPDDIPGLSRFFLDKYAAKYDKKGMTFTDETLDKLSRHSWPGNIRELQHTIEKTVILSDSDTLSPDDFYLNKQESAIPNLDNMTLEEAERLLIRNSLKRHNGNYSAVAIELGITRPTLYSKIKKYNV